MSQTNPELVAARGGHPEPLDEMSISPSTEGSEISGERVQNKIGDKINTAAASLRSHAPSGGKARSTVNSVATRLEGMGRYISETDATRLRSDATSMIHRHPMAAMACGLGAGFLFGRVFFGRRS